MKKIKLDLSQLCSLANYAGYILAHTICSVSKCLVCMKAFIDENNFEECNKLIILKEFADGSLKRPSVRANEFFREIEITFRSIRDQFKNESKSIDKITKAVLDIIQDKFLDLPQCHMKIITRRVIKGRVHFWSSFKNDEKQIINQEDIQGASCASKSTRAKTALK